MSESSQNWQLEASVYDQCVRSIYSAVTGVADWTVACDAIARAFSLQGVHIIGVDKNTGQLLFSLTGGDIPQEAFFEYVTRYHPENPRLPFALSLQGEAWVHDHELFDDQFIEANPFFQEYAIPYQARYLSGTKIVDDDSHVVMFGAIRSQLQQPLSADELREMNRIRAHLINAMAIRLKLRDSLSGHSVAGELLDVMTYPIFSVRLTGEIVHRNPHAQRLFADQGLLVEDPARFRLADREADAAFEEKLREINQVLDQRGRHAVRKFVLPVGRPVTRAAVIGIVVDPDDSMRAFGVEPTLLLIIHEVSATSSPDPFIIGKIFGLTPAESMVAAHLAGGASTHSIARVRGVTEHTIRSQVRSIYAKIGINSHPELAHRITDIPRFLSWQSDRPVT